ncbi:MAG: hypothetical protein ACK5KR_02250 [Breznakia sp.]
MDNSCSKTLLTASEYFTTIEYKVSKEIRLEATSKSFHSLIILEGSGEVISKQQSIDFKKGDSIFVPAAYGEFIIIGNCNIIETYI